MARRIRLQNSITLAVLLIGLLTGALGLGYVYWHAMQETYAPALALMWKLAGFWIGMIGLIALLGSGLARLLIQPLDRLVEEPYRTFWDHAVDAKLIVDEGGIVQDMNRRAELKLGRRAEEVIGTMVADLFAEPERSRLRELLARVVTIRKEEPAVEMHVPIASGATLTMELDMVPIEKAGNATMVLFQLSDITEKKLLEQQLLRAERLASLTHFASMFAHDIQNPLAGIKKTLEVLGHHLELQGKPVGRLFEDLQFTTELLLGMINDMLDVYQESYSGLPLAPSTFTMGDLLRDVERLFRSEADAKDVSIRLELPEEATITGDRRRLQRVWINLMHNALKYSSPRGQITISVRRQQVREPAAWLCNPVLSRAEGPGDRVLLVQVADEGPGLDASELPHIFEMFFRKKDSRDFRIGRGLGLHFCRLVVEAHGGRIWAANRPVGGAVFSVALPLGSRDRETRYADQTCHR